MARPTKAGIDYFPLDIDFFEDEKIEPISGEFGIKGEIIAIRLLCAVYRNGYFAMWNEQLKMTLAKRCSVSHELIEQVVSRLVRWNFFNESLFNSDKVLTSTGIQKRFKEATRKRKIKYDRLEYWLINDENIVIGGRNGIIGGRNPPTRELLAEETTQSKVKYSKKENYKKENLSYDEFYNFRLSEFEKLSDSHKQRFLNYGITKPIIRNTNNPHEQHIDVVDTLLQAEQDEEWIYRLKKARNLTDFQFAGYFKDFVKKFITGQEPHGIIEFQRHFSNWLNLQIK